MQHFQGFLTIWQKNWSALGGAILFYTIWPWLPGWPVTLERVAYFAPWVGCLLGCVLVGSDRALDFIHLPILTRTVLIVGLWFWSTGGLHLDGAMDTADGLAVTDPERRLTVMRDSASGAYGVMAAVMILLLKVVTLTELDGLRGWEIIMATSWARWAQVVAIARYPYLHAEGKGAFHKENIQYPQDLFWGIFLLLGLTALHISLAREKYLCILLSALVGLGLSWLVGWWFNRQLGGQTGDTYGAIVEWTEVLYLVGVLGLSQWV